MSAAAAQKKTNYAQKMSSFLDKYNRAFLVHADNVGSKQFSEIRLALRKEDAVVLMGKNTLMKKCLRNWLKSAGEAGETKWGCIVDLLVGNVGLVFTNGELTKCKEIIAEYKVPALARVGAIAPCDVIVPAGNTGMDPSQTSFFQALNVTTKITKGTVEIINDVKVVGKGDKVGGSEAALLQKLGVKPFEYGLEMQMVIEDGNAFDASVLDLSDEDLAQRFSAGLSNLTGLALATHYPAACTAPHHIINGFKELVGLALGLETFSFPQADKIKDLLAKIASGEFVPAAGGGGGGGGAAAAAPAPEPEPEEEEEEEDMGFDLFD